MHGLSDIVTNATPFTDLNKQSVSYPPPRHQMTVWIACFASVSLQVHTRYIVRISGVRVGVRIPDVWIYGSVL